ncbi:MAG: CPBP family intramembrane metalloprotease [Tissierellia bacterium]|nr:CPBP family intramembrane metalloprotease [Tissierellia bacterium]
MERLKTPTIVESNLLYLFVGILLLFGGQIVQSREIYSGLLITEFIIILLPNLIYLKARGFSLKKVLRLNRISFEQGVYTVFIMIFAYPVAVFLNVIMVSILTRFTTVLPSGVPLPSTLKEFGVGLFIMALAPGICEEVMFRGTMLTSYSKIGKNKSIIITAFLFGIFHFNLFNFIGPTFLGIILGILLFKTNSIYTSMVGHTINNSIALTIGFLVTKFANHIDEVSTQAIDIEPNAQLLVGMLVLLGIGIGSLFMLIFLLKKIPIYDSSLDIDEYEEITTEREKVNMFHFIPVVVVVAIFINLNFKFLLR